MGEVVTKRTSHKGLAKINKRIYKEMLKVNDKEANNPTKKTKQSKHLNQTLHQGEYTDGK